DAAVAALAAAPGAGADDDGMAADERAGLMARIAALEAQTEEDEALREEAAAAVKAALDDLRLLQGDGAAHAAPDGRGPDA
ncbi:MAG: hypothetical protein AAF677_01675, partial [Pseudomonadota bacterium]